jgi:hypothetical protein
VRRLARSPGALPPTTATLAASISAQSPLSTSSISDSSAVSTSSQAQITAHAQAVSQLSTAQSLTGATQTPQSDLLPELSPEALLGALSIAQPAKRLNVGLFDVMTIIFMVVITLYVARFARFCFSSFVSVCCILIVSVYVSVPLC